MIHSKRLNIDIPVQVEKKLYSFADTGSFIRYQVKDNKIPVGYVDLKDTKQGCNVMFIRNQNPDLYSGFGKLADRIEVEHCLNNKKEHPYIYSEAMIGTLIKHYKRGKRFINESVNMYLGCVLQNLKKGEYIRTGFLGTQEMFMPDELVQHYTKIIKKAPLLK